MYIVFIVLAVLVCILSGSKCVRMALNKEFAPAIFFKGLATVACIVIAAIASRHSARPEFAVPIMFGLFCGLLGDEFLGFRTVFTKSFNTCFIAGSAAFALGHIYYTTGLLRLAPKAWLIAIPVCLIALVFAFRTTKQLRMGSLFIPSGIYAAILCFMFGTAVGTMILHFSLGAVLFTVGGLLFMLSDTLLCTEYFSKRKDALRYKLLHIFYWAAQLLISLSPLLIK